MLFLWLLVGPRIELPGLYGLRVEDLVFAAMAVLCLLHWRRPARPAAPTIAAFGVAAAGLISAVVAIARGTVDPLTSVLYAVRPLEYWIAFPAALLLIRSANRLWIRRVDMLLVVVTVLQTTFAVLQYYFGLQIGFSHAAYTRAAGLTVGPYELGAISAALVVYWVAHGRFAMASLATIALASSISRISILGAAFALGVFALFWALRAARTVRRLGWRAAFPLRPHAGLRITAQALAVGTAVLVLAFTLGIVRLGGTSTATASAPPTSSEASATPVAPTTATTAAPAPTASPTSSPQTSEATDGPAPPSDSFAQRIASTSVVGSWIVGRELAAAAPAVHTSAEYADVAYTRLNEFANPDSAAGYGVEGSNLVRFFRWNLILDTIKDPLDVVFGLGPSFVGPSVDGSYLRFFAEGGLLGVLAWVALIVAWFRRTPLWMVCVTISLLVGAVFIDIVYAQRPMVLYWLLLAVAHMRQERATGVPGKDEDATNADSVARGVIGTASPT